MFHRLMLLFSLIAIIVILAMINLTTPTSVGSLGVLVFFTMIYIVIFGVVNLLVAGFYRIMGKKNRSKKERYIAATIAFAPVMLLLIQSFGVLNLATIGATIAVVFMGCFIINRSL